MSSPEVNLITDSFELGTIDVTHQTIEFTWKIKRQVFFCEVHSKQIKSPLLRTNVNQSVFQLFITQPDNFGGFHLILNLEASTHDVFGRLKLVHLHSFDEIVKDRKIINSIWSRYPLTEDTTVSFPLLMLGDLTENWVWNNDQMVIKITLEIKAVDPNYQLVIRDTELDESLYQLIKSGEYADVELMVGDVPHMAHRAILSARSPFFEGLFKSGINETLAVNVTDEATFIEILNYIYRNKFPERVQFKAPRLIEAGITFQLPEFVQSCEQQLCSTVDINSFGEYLAMSSMYGLTNLSERVVKFIQSNWVEIERLDTWKMIERRHSEIAETVRREIGLAKVDFEETVANTEQLEMEETVECDGTFDDDEIKTNY